MLSFKDALNSSKQNELEIPKKILTGLQTCQTVIALENEIKEIFDFISSKVNAMSDQSAFIFSVSSTGEKIGFLEIYKSLIRMLNSISHSSNIMIQEIEASAQELQKSINELIESKNQFLVSKASAKQLQSKLDRKEKQRLQKLNDKLSLANEEYENAISAGKNIKERFSENISSELLEQIQDRINKASEIKRRAEQDIETFNKSIGKPNYMNNMEILAPYEVIEESVAKIDVWELNRLECLQKNFTRIGQNFMDFQSKAFTSSLDLVKSINNFDPNFDMQTWLSDLLKVPISSSSTTDANKYKKIELPDQYVSSGDIYNQEELANLRKELQIVQDREISLKAEKVTLTSKIQSQSTYIEELEQELKEFKLRKSSPQYESSAFETLASKRLKSKEKQSPIISRHKMTIFDEFSASGGARRVVGEDDYESILNEHSQRLSQKQIDHYNLDYISNDSFDSVSTKNSYVESSSSNNGLVSVSSIISSLSLYEQINSLYHNPPRLTIDWYIETQQRYENYLLELKDFNLREKSLTGPWNDIDFYKKLQTQEGHILYPYKIPAGVSTEAQLSHPLSLEWGLHDIDDVQWSYAAYETLLLIFQFFRNQILAIEFANLDKWDVCKISSVSYVSERGPYIPNQLNPKDSTQFFSSFSRLTVHDYLLLTETYNTMKDLVNLIRIRLELVGDEHNIMLNFMTDGDMFFEIKDGFTTTIHPLDVRYRVILLIQAWKAANKGVLYKDNLLSQSSMFKSSINRQLHILHCFLNFGELSNIYLTESKQLPDLQAARKFFDILHKWPIEQSIISDFTKQVEDLKQSGLNETVYSIVATIHSAYEIIEDLYQKNLSYNFNAEELYISLKRLLFLMSCIGYLDGHFRRQLLFASDSNETTKKEKAKDTEDKFLEASMLEENFVFESGDNFSYYWAYEVPVVQNIMLQLWTAVTDPTSKDFLHTNFKKLAMGLLIAASVMQLGYDLTRDDLIKPHRVTTLSIQTHSLLLAQTIWRTANQNEKTTSAKFVPTKVLQTILHIMDIDTFVAWLTIGDFNTSKTFESNKETLKLGELQSKTFDYKNKQTNQRPSQLLDMLSETPIASLGMCLIRKPISVKKKQIRFQFNPDFCIASPFIDVIDSDDAKSLASAQISLSDSEAGELAIKDDLVVDLVNNPKFEKIKDKMRRKRLNTILGLRFDFDSIKEEQSNLPKQKNKVKNMTNKTSIKETTNLIQGNTMIANHLPDIGQLSIVCSSRIERVMMEILYNRLMSVAFREEIVCILCDYRYQLDPEGLALTLKLWENFHSVLFFSNEAATNVEAPNLSQLSLNKPITELLNGPSAKYNLYRYFISRTIHSLSRRLFTNARMALQKETNYSPEYLESLDFSNESYRLAFDQCREVIDLFGKAIDAFVAEFRGEIIYYSQHWEKILPFNQHALICIHSGRRALYTIIKELLASKYWPENDIPPHGHIILQGIGAYEKIVNEVQFTLQIYMPIEFDLLAPFHNSVIAALHKRFKSIRESFERYIQSEDWVALDQKHYSATIVDIFSLIYHLFPAIEELKAPINWVVPCFLQFIKNLTLIYIQSVLDFGDSQNEALLNFVKEADYVFQHLHKPSPYIEGNTYSKESTTKRLQGANVVRQKIFKGFAKMTKIRTKKKKNDIADFDTPNDDIFFMGYSGIKEPTRQNESDLNETDIDSGIIQMDDIMLDITLVKQNTNILKTKSGELRKKRAQLKKQKRKIPDDVMHIDNRLGYQIATCTFMMKETFKSSPLKTCLVRLHNFEFFGHQLELLSEKFLKLAMSMIKARDSSYREIRAALLGTVISDEDEQPNKQAIFGYDEASTLEQITKALEASMQAAQNTMTLYAESLASKITARLVYHEFKEELFEDLYNPNFKSFTFEDLSSGFQHTIEKFFEFIPASFTKPCKKYFLTHLTKCWLLVITELGYNGVRFTANDIDVIDEDLETLKQLYTQFNVPNEIAIKENYFNEMKVSVTTPVFEYIQKFINLISNEPNLLCSMGGVVTDKLNEVTLVSEPTENLSLKELMSIPKDEETTSAIPLEQLIDSKVIPKKKKGWKKYLNIR